MAESSYIMGLYSYRTITLRYYTVSLVVMEGSTEYKMVNVASGGVGKSALTVHFIVLSEKPFFLEVGGGRSEVSTNCSIPCTICASHMHS